MALLKLRHGGCQACIIRITKEYKNATYRSPFINSVEKDRKKNTFVIDAEDHRVTVRL